MTLEDKVSLAEVLKIIDACPFAPGTHTGNRQAWVKSAIKADLLGMPRPEFKGDAAVDYIVWRGVPVKGIGSERPYLRLTEAHVRDFTTGVEFELLVPKFASSFSAIAVDRGLVDKHFVSTASVVSSDPVLAGLPVPAKDETSGQGK